MLCHLLPKSAPISLNTHFFFFPYDTLGSPDLLSLWHWLSSFQLHPGRCVTFPSLISWGAVLLLHSFPMTSYKSHLRGLQADQRLSLGKVIPGLCTVPGPFHSNDVFPAQTLQQTAVYERHCFIYVKAGSSCGVVIVVCLCVFVCVVCDNHRIEVIMSPLWNASWLKNIYFHIKAA